jgi:chromosome segregation ATPase
MLIHDLESEAKTQSLKDYMDLADKVASLRVALKSCHDMLTSKHGRIERWDDKIHNLKEEIAALKRLKSSMSMTVSSM